MSVTYLLPDVLFHRCHEFAGNFRDQVGAIVREVELCLKRGTSGVPQLDAVDADLVAVLESGSATRAMQMGAALHRKMADGVHGKGWAAH